MLIEVTTEHIRDGKLFSPGRCPVALAIKSLLGDKTYVSVSPDTVTIGDLVPANVRDTYVSLPRIAREFISVFDRRYQGSVHPFSFELDYKPNQEAVNAD